jgi:hypothetical protein
VERQEAVKVWIEVKGLTVCACMLGGKWALRRGGRAAHFDSGEQGAKQRRVGDAQTTEPDRGIEPAKSR